MKWWQYLSRAPRILCSIYMTCPFRWHWMLKKVIIIHWLQPVKKISQQKGERKRRIRIVLKFFIYCLIIKRENHLPSKTHLRMDYWYFRCVFMLSFFFISGKRSWVVVYPLNPQCVYSINPISTTTKKWSNYKQYAKLSHHTYLRKFIISFHSTLTLIIIFTPKYLYL